MGVFALAADMWEQGKTGWDTPGALAHHLFPKTVNTPALDLIDAALAAALRQGDGRLIITMPPQEGKALALDTPIATPTGWTEMGSLRVGDVIFGGDGKPCRVTWVSPVWEGRDCYEVTTGDGERIVADGAHEWVARLCNKRPTRIVETSTLARSRTKNAQILTGPGIDMPDANLPIDPYVFGVWLGDGTTGHSDITSHPDDVDVRERFADAGWPLRHLGRFRWTMSPEAPNGTFGRGNPAPAKAALRATGALTDKHVPDLYKRASRTQRLALLQGLIDSDGHVAAKGQVEFCSVKRRLAEDVQELVYSLGAKATLHEGRATIDGRDCGTKYRVRFYLANAAHMRRKAERCRDSSVARVRYVKASACASQPTVCIEVDSSDHTFLAGRSLLPTHNSSRVTRDLPVWLLARNSDLRIVTASYAQTLANRNGRAIRNAIVTHPELGIRIAPDNGSVSDWTIDKHEGGVLSVGIGAGLTGRPADCIGGDTLIECEHGKLTAAEAFEIGIRRIRSYDHATDRAVWRNVEAARRIPSRAVVEVITQSGRTLTCTPDHRVYTGRGYVAAGSLRDGDSLLAFVGADRVIADPISVVRTVGSGPVDVYDFQVAGTHNFFADGLLVHNCLLIDDPIKDRAEADSEVYRDRVWDWWTEVGSTRLAPGAPVIVILCMTGDTPVLRPDGTETPLRDIRPGDEVATYNSGELGVSKVVNHTPQGYDSVYRITTSSGATVRANGRHPFLVLDDGVEVWRRTDQIKTGAFIMRATGASTAESCAPPKDATNQQNARAFAARITAKIAGHLGTALRRIIPDHVRAGQRNSSTATASLSTITNALLKSKVGHALFAASLRRKSSTQATGHKCCALTTATTAAPCEGCCATTAISSSPAGTPPESFAALLNTWSVNPDEVISVEPVGEAEVFDVQIAGTENFIADGLVSHNTRWHHDDLAGRLLAAEDGHLWTVLNIPAQADHRPERGETDPLGREPGEFMASARDRTQAQWEAIKIRVGARTWASLYQGRPTPDKGNVLPETWWQRWEHPPWIERADGARIIPDVGRLDDVELVQSWDLAFKDTKSSDFVVGQVWLRRGANAYLLDQARGRYSFTETCRQIRAMTARWPQAIAKLIEDKANGPAVINSLKATVGGMIAVEPEGSKVARANAISPLVESGNVLIPPDEHAAWVGDLIEEAKGFPNGAHDDQVDALTQAVHRLLLVPLINDDTYTADDLTDDDEADLPWVANY